MSGELENDGDCESDDEACWKCGGDGVMWGEDFDDPDWYEPGKLYACPNCRGTGSAGDCTYW